MGYNVSEEQAHDQPSSSTVSKRFKIPKNFLNGCNGVHHAVVPRKIRSAMKKRNRESILLDSEKVNHKISGTESTGKDSVKKSKKKQRINPDWSPRGVSVSGPITKDEEEVAETLFALAGMFHNNGSKHNVEGFEGLQGEPMPENSTVLQDLKEHANVALEGSATARGPESSLREASRISSINETSGQEQAVVVKRENRNNVALPNSELCLAMGLNMTLQSRISQPSVLVVPYPAQGHVNALMIFSKKMVENGCNCKVIFLNTDFNHKRVVSSMQGDQQQQGGDGEELIKLVSIPDGLGPEDDKIDFEKLYPALLSTMPASLEKLIEDIHLNGEYRITCIVADVLVGWVLDVGRKLGINGALFWPASAALFALMCNIPKLTHDGIIDSDGLSTTKETFQISPRMPVMDKGALFWSNFYDSKNILKILFNYINHCTKKLHQTEWWLCNTAYELEPGALSFIPKLQPVGPLLSTSHDNTNATTSRSMGQFWKEDLSCMSWLDQQPHQSVVYLAFGSFTLFEQNQFKELAHGIDLTNRPFLWVVRQDNNMAYPSEFLGSKGKIVEWAPQQKVLNHPSIACFVSHCGWNSTMEGLSNGVPFLCWPYFADQLYDKTFICDELKVGIGMDSDENGVVSRWEIKKKVEQLLSDETLRSRSLELKGRLMKDIAEGGRSLENLRRFVKWLEHKE